MPAIFSPTTEPLRLHFYTVALHPVTSGDLRGATDAMIARLRARAEAQKLEQSVRITADGQALAQKGIFFLQAPARFADDVRATEGVKSVDTPLNKRKSHPRRVSR